MSLAMLNGLKQQQYSMTVEAVLTISVLKASPRRRLGDKALLCFGPPRRFSPPRRRLSPPRRLGGGDSPQLALTP